MVNQIPRFAAEPAQQGQQVPAAAPKGKAGKGADEEDLDALLAQFGVNTEAAAGRLASPLSKIVFCHMFLC